MADDPKKEEEKDFEETTKKIAQEAAEEAARKVVEESKKVEPPKEEVNEPEPQEKEYEDWVEGFQKDKGRRPTYMEAMEFVSTKVEENIAKKEEVKVKEAEETQKQQQQEQQEERDRINRFVDDELQELYSSGRLTKIEDPNNPSDQGVIERKALFQAWQTVNQQRRTEGKPEIISATRIFEFYYKKPNQQPAGEQAPIAGAQNSGEVPSENKDIDYMKDIRNK